MSYYSHQNQNQQLNPYQTSQQSRFSFSSLFTTGATLLGTYFIFKKFFSEDGDNLLGSNHTSYLSNPNHYGRSDISRSSDVQNPWNHLEHNPSSGFDSHTQKHQHQQYQHQYQHQNHENQHQNHKDSHSLPSRNRFNNKLDTLDDLPLASPRIQQTLSTKSSVSSQQSKSHQQQEVQKSIFSSSDIHLLEAKIDSLKSQLSSLKTLVETNQQLLLAQLVQNQNQIPFSNLQQPKSYFPRDQRSNSQENEIDLETDGPDDNQLRDNIPINSYSEQDDTILKKRPVQSISIANGHDAKNPIEKRATIHGRPTLGNGRLGVKRLNENLKRSKTYRVEYHPVPEDILESFDSFDQVQDPLDSHYPSTQTSTGLNQDVKQNLFGSYNQRKQKSASVNDRNGQPGGSIKKSFQDSPPKSHSKRFLNNKVDEPVSSEPDSSGESEYSGNEDIMEDRLDESKDTTQATHINQKNASLVQSSNETDDTLETSQQYLPSSTETVQNLADTQIVSDSPTSLPNSIENSTDPASKSFDLIGSNPNTTESTSSNLSASNSELPSNNSTDEKSQIKMFQSFYPEDFDFDSQNRFLKGLSKFQKENGHSPSQLELVQLKAMFYEGYAKKKAISNVS